MTSGAYPGSNGLSCNTIHLAFVVEYERDSNIPAPMLHILS